MFKCLNGLDELVPPNRLHITAHQHEYFQNNFAYVIMSNGIRNFLVVTLEAHKAHLHIKVCNFSKYLFYLTDI